MNFFGELVNPTARKVGEQLSNLVPQNAVNPASTQSNNFQPLGQQVDFKKMMTANNARHQGRIARKNEVKTSTKVLVLGLFGITGYVIIQVFFIKKRKK